jgi:PKD repeat protein
VAKDDISSLVSFDTNTTSPKILLMWSNQRDHTVNVAIHIDGQPETSWTPRRIAYSGSNSADDHINLKSLESDDSGRVFAAIKTSRTGASDPLVVLLVYNRSTGAWSNAVFGTVADKHTRPIILLDKTNNIIHIYAAADEGGGSIYGKTTSMSSPRFAGGRGTPFIEEAATPGLGGRLNNATSTKQSVNCQTGIVVLATNDTSDRYWHNYEAIPGCGSVPTLPVANFSATPRTGTAPLTVSFSDSSTNNPTSWAWDFDNSGNVDSTIPNPSFTYTTAGTYTVKLTVTNADGADTEIKTGYIVVGSEGGSSTVTLLPNGDAARDAVIKDQASATTNLYAAIDETIAATDNSSTWIRNNSNTSGSYLAQLGDMPANFSDMLTLSIDIQVRTTSRVDDNTTLYAQVVKANGTALTNEIAVASNPGLTAWTTISGVAFTGVAPATKADWDGAQLKLRWAYTATGTADGTQVRLSTVELDGTFN